MPFAMFFLQNQVDPEQAKHIAMTVLAMLPFIILIGFAIIVIPWWFLCKKAGFSPWMSLLCIIPGGSLLLLYLVAFLEWKVVPAPTAWAVPPPYPPNFPPPPSNYPPQPPQA